MDWVRGDLIAAFVSGLVALMQSRMSERLTRLSHALDAELNGQSALMDRDLPLSSCEGTAQCLGCER